MLEATMRFPEGHGWWCCTWQVLQYLDTVCGNAMKLSAGTSAKLILSPLLFRRHLPLKVSEALLHLLLPIPAISDVPDDGGNS